MDDLVGDKGTMIYHPTEEEMIKMCLHKMVCFYGLTGTGKSVGAKTFLNYLSKVVPRFLIYSKTENVNGDYSKIAPLPCISSVFDVSKLVNDMEFQDNIMNFWKVSNDKENLRSVAEKVCDKPNLDKMTNKVNSLQKLYDRETYENKKKIEVAINAIYKDYIWRNVNSKDLTSDELRTVQFMDINPCFAWIIDDFAAELETATKNVRHGKDFFKSLAYNLRHYFMTAIFMLQSIKALELDVRNNVHTCIFSEKKQALKYFKLSGDKELAKEAEEVCSVVFRDNDHKILIYCRDGTMERTWYYTIGDPSVNVVLGCEPLYTLCNQIGKKLDGQTINESNSFFADLN